MWLFFGDSLTEGSNCYYSFTDFIDPIYNPTNLGVSGTTIGEYSIYPVDGHSLLRQIAKYKMYVKKASVIFIEYGSNDVSAVMCGFATIQTVVVSLVKAVDWIKQLNPYCKIVFLAPGSDDIISTKAVRMCNYLEKDYFKKFDFNFPTSVYADIYKQIISQVNNICDIIYMFDDEMISEEYLSDDNIHPNEQGHKRIANNIMHGMKKLLHYI